MRFGVALRLARRELRSGTRGFRVFLLCLILGVAAIATVGSVRDAVQGAVADQGAVLLGGDAQMEFTYRYATEEERAWMNRNVTRVAEVVEFRSMVVAGEDRALTQVKAVDGAYPLYGTVDLGGADLAAALRGDRVVMARTLVERLGLGLGDTVQLGTKAFALGGVFDQLPDDAGGGFTLGPPMVVRREALEGSGLLGAGTLFETEYKLTLPPDTNLSALKRRAEARFADAGMRWRDSRNAAPGLTRFVDRIGAFLVLVGLAGLAVGGVGVAAAVRAYLDGKVPVIATLKTLGAENRLIFQVYLVQIGVLAVIGIAVGVAIGAVVPMAAYPVLAASLPLSVEVGVYPAALGEAALYGTLCALLFSLWPLARAGQIRAASLFRDAVSPSRVLPGWRIAAVLGLLAVVLVASSAILSGVPHIAIGSAVAVAGSLILLTGAAWAVRRGARAMMRARFVQGRPVLRLALSGISAPGGEARSVVLSLGLGLSVLAAVGQVDRNLQLAIAGELPDVAPSYFVVDIQPAQIEGYLDRVTGDEGVKTVETAPMLRGVITKINDRPAQEVAGDHWVIRGDRGLTYAPTPPSGTVITAGEWWDADYTGPPLVSFADEEAREIGLNIGDAITVNVLGRDITATVSSFRIVDFSTAGIGFVMSMNPAALQGAPHSFISTIYADREAEAGLVRDLSRTYPNITLISVRDAIERVAGLVGNMAAAITFGAGATLITGVFVLIGTAAAAQNARMYEAAILKTLGAERRMILTYLTLRAGILGAASGLVAVVAGGASAWAVITFVMDGDFRFDPVSAAVVIGSGGLVTLLSGIGFAWAPLRARPARILRAAD